jgi:hypothetical protein
MAGPIETVTEVIVTDYTVQIEYADSGRRCWHYTSLPRFDDLELWERLFEDFPQLYPVMGESVNGTMHFYGIAFTPHP